MTKIIVKKFGGTSVGTLERIQIVAKQIAHAKLAGENLVVVVSAMSGETDRLLNLAYDLSLDPNSREVAALITTGEQVSAALLAIALSEQGVQAKSYNAAQLSITTDNAHTKARIIKMETQKILTDLKNSCVVIVTGFQGLTEQGEITALGRGGSDTSAVALACALKAHECQIFTDVEGVYTADPRLVPNAYRMSQIPFPAMLTLAKLGSKVLQWRSVALAGKYQIPLRVLSSFKDGEGTLMNYDDNLEAPQLAGLSHATGLTRWLIKIESSQGNELSRIAKALACEHIVIENIQQTSLQKHTTISLILNREEQAHAGDIIEKMVQENHWIAEKEFPFARLSLVGIGLHSHPEIAEKFLSVLLALEIKAQEVIYTELALSVILTEAELSKAAQALHAAFFEEKM